MPLDQNTKKKIIRRIQEDRPRVEKIFKAWQYYYIDNPILRQGVVADRKDILRKADNRIAHNFHQTITDEEVDYLLSYEPIIDIGDSNANLKIVQALGDSFLKKMRKLDIETCNSGCGWMHYWLDDKRKLCYAPVPSDQIIPIMADGLEEELAYIIRHYPVTVERDGTRVIWHRVEVWDKSCCEFFFLKGTIGLIGSAAETADDGTLYHPFGDIPFIAFANNNRKQGCLPKYQGHVDAYDIVLSGYVNDVMDIQQAIYILENFAGTDLKDFTSELRKYKTVKVGSDGIDGSSGDLRALTIDIPVEARNSLLESLEKQIYKAAQALPRDVTSVGNASGQALKFFYKDLDLKVGDKEVEFTDGLRKLIRVICKYNGIADPETISIIFTRNRIHNDQETAQICSDSVGVLPMELIWANHPFVDNLEKCKELWEKEQNEQAPSKEYRQAGNYGDGDDDADEA